VPIVFSQDSPNKKGGFGGTLQWAAYLQEIQVQIIKDGNKAMVWWVLKSSSINGSRCNT